MSVANFPIDLVLLGMIAAFLVLRLRSVLGKRTGFERQGPQGATTPRPLRGSGKVIDLRAEPATDRTSMPRVLPERDSAIGQTLTRIQAVDGSFTPGRFLDGAEAAFRLIVLAFARGDRAALRPLLAPPLMEVFDAAITAREAAHQVQHTTIHSIRSAAIDGAGLDGKRADLSVRFVSDQVNYTNDSGGATIVGAEALTEIADLWSFERELGSGDPSWRLVAAQSA